METLARLAWLLAAAFQFIRDIGRARAGFLLGLVSKTMQRAAPESKISSRREIPGTGLWHQRFTLFMPGDPASEPPFHRTGTKPDLSNPQVRVDLWKTLKAPLFND